MKSIMRRYRNAEDYWHIRAFLREVLLITNREQVNWETARFDYWRWHGILNMKGGTLEDDVFIWETKDEKIAAVLNREGPGSVFLQIHPLFRNTELEAEMLSVAERHLTVPVNDNRRHLHVWAEREDAQLREILENRGYAICSKRRPEYQRRRMLTEPISSLPAADGYTIRSMGDTDEHLARNRASWRAFHPNDPDKNFEDDWYLNFKRAPLYRRDLDLVAVAANGEIAAFCNIWFDDVTLTGLFEPVGTVPEHQRRGLGKAILTEGLIRLQRLGADMAYVGSYTEPAHALYASVGFKEYRILDPWVKDA